MSFYDYFSRRVLSTHILLAITSANLHLGDKRDKQNRQLERCAMVCRRFYGSIEQCKASLMRRFVLRTFR